MQTIVSEGEDVGQGRFAAKNPSRDFNGDFLAPPCVTAPLRENGYVLLPGLAHWLTTLSPQWNREAWQALHNEKVQQVLHGHFSQRPHHLVNDGGEVDRETQLDIAFKWKPAKSHLTVIEGSWVVANCPMLPAKVQAYLKSCLGFLQFLRKYYNEVIGQNSLPTTLMLRIFQYHATVPVIPLPQPAAVPDAMRPHVDGSVCTLIIADSDGLLQFEHGGVWHPAVRHNLAPFALLIPGIAAWHDFQILPTLHKVLPSIDARASVTVFLTPALHPNRATAESVLSKWRLASVPNVAKQ